MLNLAMQDLHIRNSFPGFSRNIARSTGMWSGKIQPSDISCCYDVSIEYNLAKTPKVSVRWPTLHPRAPHLYPDGTLCLYWPKEWRWQGNEIIAETILPWTALWLYYYELWLDTGYWLGPSAHGTNKMLSEHT